MVYGDLFKQSTKELKVTRYNLSSQLTSEHIAVACNPIFTTTPRQHLAKVHVETNTLGGASCYNPASIFHFPPSITMPLPPVT